MTIDYKSILENAKIGSKIPEFVVADIRDQLSTRSFREDPYTLIHILGKTGDVSSLPLIKQYIDYDTGVEESDAFIRRIAVLVVGRMWKMPELFDEIVRKAFGDSSKYVRHTAARVMGFLGATYPQLRRQSAATLVRGVKKAWPDAYTRDGFYYGLLELLNVPIAEWPNQAEELKQDDIREDLLMKAKELSRDGGMWATNS